MLEELYLVRHAAPDRTLAMPYNVLPGPPLTPAGEREAAQTACWLAERGVQHLLASPFARARATAEAAAAESNLPLTFVDALREGGPGENMDQVRARVAELLTQVEDSPLARVALVTHGACIRALLQHTTDSRIDLSGHVYDNGNCAPTAGVWRGTRADGRWSWELAFRPTAEEAITSADGRAL
ncbi:MAG TPA: histidine phosphatase family protein [Roseiflexaceae bacterium]|nr:histidine phosphatase family protein [Roseiflexaceae bacterium]